MCLCDINAIINIKYNQCECVNDDVDDMNNETWIVIDSTLQKRNILKTKLSFNY